MKKLGMGMMRLPLTDAKDPKSVDMEQVCRMVDTFLERGFTYIDTAYMYHSFQSEIVVREALVKRHPRESFVLASKLPTMYLKEEGDQERIFAEQLEKCGVEYFDYYLVHSLDEDHYQTAQKFDSFGFVAKLKAQPYFCLPHYRALLECAEARLQKKKAAAFAKDCSEIVNKYLAELKDDISWFCKKFDYRYGDEPWYNSKDSVERSIRFLRSDLHLPEPPKK